MFSSLAQYLPSAIQGTISNHTHTPEQQAEEQPPPQSTFDPNTDDEGDEEELVRQQSRQMEEATERKPKSKKEKDAAGKTATETFIFVRPPPSKTNHPLNLQVQLVPPNARPPSGVQVPGMNQPTTPTSATSFASTSSNSGETLSRTSSRHSEYSTTYASNNSTTSFASVASGETSSSAASSSSGRSSRRIIPLYNLQAHNVLPNVIADAGTEAKIAKFQKKGLELIDLAVLEPVEVWGARNKSGEKEAKKQGMKISVDEMGAIVHTGLGINAKAGTANGRSATLGGFLQAKSQRDSSRPATSSANSSALSLASNSTNISQQPQLVISPPAPSLPPHPPASAPPISGTFPSSQLPHKKPPTPPIEIAAPFPEHPDATPPSIVVSTTPTKRSSAANLFGKLKFGSKRASSLNPLSPSSSISSTDTPLSPPPVTTSQTPMQPLKTDFAKFGMTPAVAEGSATRQAPQLEAKRPSTLKSPISPDSIRSQNSNTPTSATPWKAHQAGASNEEVGSPTPTASPMRAGFRATLASAATSSMQPGPSPVTTPPSSEGSSPSATKTNLNIGSALTKGRNRFIGGLKGAAVAPVVPPPEGPAPSSPTGAKGFFNKIAAGITGNGGTPTSESGTATVSKRMSGLFARPSADEGRNARDSVDPGQMPKLHHTSSQQFIGIGTQRLPASGSGSNGNSVNPSPRPSQDLNAPQQPPPSSAASTSASAAQQPASYTQSFVSTSTSAVGAGGSGAGNGVVGLQAQQLSLKQLQLRPPVLGIQPTYVSASQNAAAEQSLGPSAVSLALGPNGLPVGVEVSAEPGRDGSGSGGGVPLSKVESWSSLAQTEESGSGSVVGSSNKRRARGNSNGRNDVGGPVPAAMGPSGTVMEAGPAERDREVTIGAAGASAAQGKDKERALMYVWLVAKWMKKRERGGHAVKSTNEHTQNVSESSTGGGGSTRNLFRDILPGRDKEGRGSSIINGIRGGDKEAKRGSWHGGPGIGGGLLSSLGAPQQPGQRAKTSSSESQPVIGLNGRPLVLGPIVGGGFEVRFEWKRAKTRGSKAKGGRSQEGEEQRRGRGKDQAGGEVKDEGTTSAFSMGRENEDTPRVSQGPLVETSPKKLTKAEQKRLNRMSTTSIGSFALGDKVREDGSPSSSTGSPSRTSSRARRRISLIQRKRKDGEEEGEDEEVEDSDSEDSETPWVCTMKVRKIAYVQTSRGSSVVDHIATLGQPSAPRLVANGEIGVSGSGSGNGSRGGEKGEKDPVLRMKVGTLSPTPHHPKVVAMLKVPFPLPDVEVERMKLVKRKGMMFGQNAVEDEVDSQQEGAPYNGLTLTAEDIKDIVCSTGLWLVVREGFGGVGKVNRKGDGWKIRG